MEKVIEIAKKLIAIESITPECTNCLNYVQEILNDLNFKTQRMVFGKNKYPNEDYKVDNLFAIYGNGERNFCFAGHVDVVPTGDLYKWKNPPFKPTIIDGKLYGRGACDMKGAIAAFLAAIDEILPNVSIKQHTISLLITGDEEDGSKNGTYKMLEKLNADNVKIDFCLVGEPSSSKILADQIKIGRRGSFTAKIIITGKQGHVAYPENANNPILTVSKIINDLHSIQLNKESSKLNIKSNLEIVGLQSSTQTSNIIPNSAELLLNIRYNDQYTPKDIISILENIIIKHEDNIKSELKVIKSDTLPFIGSYNPKYETLIKNACKKLMGNFPLMCATGGTSDARFINKYTPCIELGLINKTAHQINEHVNVNDIIKLKNLYVEILQNWFLIK